MSLQYVKSKKGGAQLLYNGYLHTKERVFGKKTVWKCAYYHRDHCPGRAHTCDGRVIKYSPHKHPPIKTAREAKRTERSTKTTILSGPQLTHEAALPNSDGLPETVPTKKLCLQNVKQTIQRLRARMCAFRTGVCHIQALSAPAAESVPEVPSSACSIIPPNLEEGLERFKYDNSTVIPMLCRDPKSSHSALLATREAGRQKFRSGTVPGTNPREILSYISEAAQQWLCPQEHSKDQVVDMVILEQFLAVLPVGMQAWVKAAEPSSSMEAVQLAETYLADQSVSGAGQELKKGLITFEDVSLCFSEEEWALLDQEEKALYWNVMHQNYENVAWLTGEETGSKGEEDPWHETFEPIELQLDKSNKEISWGFKQNSVRDSHIERQPKSIAEDLKEITGAAALGLETSCDEPFSLIGGRNGHREEGPEPAVLCGELQESSEKKIPQYPEENLIEEGQKDAEGQPSNSLGMEENLIPFTEGLRDHQDSRPGQETLCMAVEVGNHDESLNVLHEQNIYIEDDFECVALPEGSVFISSVEEIPQSVEENSQPECIHVYSLSESSKTYSKLGENGTTSLTNQKAAVLDMEQNSSPGKEDGEEESVLSANCLLELTTDPHFSHAQPTVDPQPSGPSPGKSSEHSRSQKSSQEEDLTEGPGHKRPFILSPASTTQSSCFDSEGNSGSFSGLMKHKRFDKRRKLCRGRNMPVRYVLGTQQKMYPGGKIQKRLNGQSWWASRKWRCRFPERQTGLRAPRKQSSVNIHAQPPETLQMATETHATVSEVASSSDSGEAEARQSTPSLLDKMAAEPIMVKLMAVLEQVAADTAEIKSAISRLHPTMADIQNVLGNLSGCTDNAEHRISDLEFTSWNTKAQLVQHCNDIKAIEAKLVGKAVQTNVIAGLWPLLGIKREMSP